MICKWYHVWNALPNKWLNFDEIIEVVKKRYPTVTNVDEAVKDYVKNHSRSKTILGKTKYRWY